eukprot:c6981_g1_i2.p1 GENE.c6981_g1_i2~~c6981_g1_i2.p1  ORF type:complete len:124 (-),score=14.95 c6981_g1_i2:32-403(-)
MIGSILFSYSSLIALPSWFAEKASFVDVGPVIKHGLTWSSIVYALIGIFGAWAYKFADNQNLLQTINKQQQGPVLLKLTIYLFPLIVNVPSIPIFAIVSRYNLLESNLCSSSWCTFVDSNSDT